MTREVAYKVWKLYLEKGVFLSKGIEREIKKVSLSDQNMAFLFELLYGTCRQKAFIESIIKRFVKRKRTPSFALISLGVYQILFMRSVTDYAAVNESVEVAKKCGLKRESAFINAVLRKVVSEKSKLKVVPSDKELKNASLVASYLSYPEWIVKKIHFGFGTKKGNNILASLNKPAFVLLHFFNTNKCVDKKKDYTISDIDEEVFVMSPSQKASVDMLEIKKGLKVLDLCSSPGGKARVIEHLLKGNGELVCVEKNIKKLRLQKKYRETKALKLCNSKIRTNFLCADVTYVNEIFLSGYFDRIMLDVPCSNTGEMSKCPEVRWRLKEADIKRLSKIQFLMLKSSSKLIKKNGLLIYSTCSLFEEENKNVVSKFLEDERNFFLEEEEIVTPNLKSPFGGYHAKIRKVTT